MIGKSQQLFKDYTCIQLERVRTPGSIIWTMFLQISGSRDMSVGVATGWTATVRISAGASFIPFSATSQTGSGSTQTPIQWAPGPLSSGIKRPGREADRSSPSSAEVKKDGAIYRLPRMSLCLINLSVWATLPHVYLPISSVMTHPSAQTESIHTFAYVRERDVKEAKRFTPDATELNWRSLILAHHRDTWLRQKGERIILQTWPETIIRSKNRDTRHVLNRDYSIMNYTDHRNQGEHNESLSIDAKVVSGKDEHWNSTFLRTQKAINCPCVNVRLEELVCDG
jgi:hypothetical protein